MVLCANLVSGQQKILRLYLIGAISSAASADSSFNRISPRNVTFSALEMGGHESEYNKIGFEILPDPILPSSVHRKAGKKLRHIGMAPFG